MKAIQKLTKLFLAACCFVSVITMNQVIEIKAADEGEIIDDNDARFVYSSGNSNNGGWDYWPTTGGSSADVTEHWSNSAGATIDITFNGTKLELYGKKAANHAMFSVAIDGGTATEHDAYASTTQTNVKLYESAELSPGDHTAKVTVLGKRNSASTGSGTTYGVQFVYAKVFGNSDTGFTVIEDVMATETDELFKIKYTGTWGGGESYYPDYFHDGYEHYTSNGYFEMRFVGTKFQLIGSKNSGHGVYKISVDGTEVGTADATTTGSVQHQQMLFESSELDNKEHTLKVELKSGSALQIDYLKVYHEDMPITRIFADTDDIDLGINQTAEFPAISYEPWFNEEPEIVYSSADSSVATIDANGNITAVSKTAAQTQVTATVKDTTISTSVTINVDPAIKDLNVSVGNEKLLETQRDFDDLLAAEIVRNWSGVAWKGDILNSKLNILAKANVHNINITASDFTDNNGNKIAADNIDIKWLKNVKANDGRNLVGTVLDFPDVIHKGGAHDAAKNTTNFAWVSMNVPQATVPGNYTGKITVTADELANPIELTYEIEVLNLVQPENEKTELQIWQHPFAVANYYLGLGSTPSGGISNDSNDAFYFTEQHFNLMRESVKEYADNGGHDIVANIVEEAWGHQSYYNDPSMIKWTKKSDGTWEFNYDWYDKWINFMIDSGVIDPVNGIGKIKCFSIVPWGNQIKYYNEATSAYKTEVLKAGTTAGNAAWSAFLTDFMKHSKEKGWFDITYISMDERLLPDLTAAVNTIESVTDSEGDSFKISSALNYAAPDQYTLTDRVDDISINLGNVTSQTQLNQLSEHRRALGLNTTFYSCTGDYPTNFMISDPGDNYWTIWYTMTLGTDGFMRWAWDNYVYDMHGDTSYRYWEPGDGWYVYPVERDQIDADYNASFYSTPRYEMLKQGMRDVAKAKYLMEQSDEYKTEITTLTKSMKLPVKSTYHGSATYADEVQRMLVHSETARMYDKVTELAREFAATQVVVDKSLLEAEIAKAEILTEKDYTADSWADLQSALTAAQQVNGDADATQDEVNKACAALQAAYKALVTVPEVDKSDLLTAINKAEILTEDHYTAASWKVLEAALKAAQQVEADADATQAEVDNACDALNKAVDDLVKVDPTIPDEVYKGDLTAAIQRALSLTEDHYTAESWKNLEAVLKTAQQVEANADANQDEVDDAYKALNAAMNALVKVDPSIPDEVYKGDLTAAIHRAQSLTAEHYTADSWKALEAALRTAQQVEADADANQDEVDAACTALNSAIKALVKVDPTIPDEVFKGDLLTEIKKAEALTKDDYKADSWAVLEAALTKAKAIYQDTNATQDEIDNACASLAAAIKALVKTDSSTPTPTPKPPKPSNPIKPNEPIKPIKPNLPGYVNQIHNNINQVTVLGRFPEDVQLIVETLTDTAKAEIINKITNKNDLAKYNIEKIYDIYMLQKGMQYKPDGAFTIKIKLDDELLAKRYLGIVYIADDGTVTMVPSKVKDGFITFTTNHNSYYAIVSSDSPIVNTATTGSIIGNNTFAVIMLGMLLAFVVKKSDSLLKKESE